MSDSDPNSIITVYEKDVKSFFQEKSIWHDHICPKCRSDQWDNDGKDQEKIVAQYSTKDLDESWYRLKYNNIHLSCSNCSYAELYTIGPILRFIGYSPPGGQ